MIKSALAEAAQQCIPYSGRNHSTLVRRGLETLQPAREFEQCFSQHSEHKIVHSEHDFGPPDNWRSVYDWLSRTQLFNRYVLMLSTAIDITTKGELLQLKSPEVFLFEVIEVPDPDDIGEPPKFKLQIGQIEDDAWREFVNSGGDFAIFEDELVANQPVPRFDVYWRNTQHGWILPPRKSSG